MICAPAAARPAFRVGAWDRNGRERSEDGADDHLLQTGSKLASLWGNRAGTVSPRRSRLLVSSWMKFGTKFAGNLIAFERVNTEQCKSSWPLRRPFGRIVIFLA